MILTELLLWAIASILIIVIGVQVLFIIDMVRRLIVHRKSSKKEDVDG